MPQLLEDIARPISDSEPSGEDIAKLAPTPENEEWIKNYADLRQLINRMASNSDSIVALSQSILMDKSKDLRIAGNLCLGLLHQKGFAGLAHDREHLQRGDRAVSDRSAQPASDRYHAG